jgi:hypothetical protein
VVVGSIAGLFKELRMVSEIFRGEHWDSVKGFDFQDITYHRAKRQGTVRIAFNRQISETPFDLRPLMSCIVLSIMHGKHLMWGRFCLQAMVLQQKMAVGPFALVEIKR